MVKRFRSMTYPYIAWIIAIIVVPMLLIVLYAFTTSGNSVLTFQFTFENFARFVTDKVFMDVLLRSSQRSSALRSATPSPTSSRSAAAAATRS